MIKRQIFQSLQKAADYKKAILLLGPRQAGKTTLMKALANDLHQEYLYINGDEPAIQTQFGDASLDYLKAYIGNYKVVLVDEAQRIRNIGILLKLIIDNIKGVQLLVTGSSALELANTINEPLTGRKWEYLLYPVSWNELMSEGSLATVLPQLETMMIYGMYPDVLTTAEKKREVLNNLASSYLYKDLLSFQGIRKPELLSRLVQALALQLGAPVNISEVGRTIQANKITVENYIDLLEKAFIVYKLPPFNRNLRTEISSNRKIYFFDNGIRNAVIGNYAHLELRTDTGALWENFVITERRKLLRYHNFYGRTYFWRTHSGQEIDYIEEIDGRLYAFEFKWNPNAKSKIPKTFIETYQPQETATIHRDNFWQWLQTYPY